MKTAKLFLKFLLFLNLLTAATAAHAQLTSEHFLYAFGQLEKLADQKGTSAQALRMEVYNEFNMAKDLRPEEFNTVVFELLLKYSQNPKLRTDIQNILTELSKNVDADIFNARQRFETPLVIARALTWGFTIVIAARSVRTLYHMGTSQFAMIKDALNPQIKVPKNAMTALESSKDTAKLSLSARMGYLYQSATQKCFNSTMCSNWSVGVLTGSVLEGISYYLDSLDTAKVNPLEALRLVQAHLACELHWDIIDYSKKWEQETDWQKTRLHVNLYGEQVQQFQKSYSALKDVYKKDLNDFIKNYPKSENWWKLASSIVDSKGRTCQQISTGAMLLDLQQIGNAFKTKYRTELEEEVEQERKKIEQLMKPEKTENGEKESSEESLEQEIKIPDQIPNFKDEDL